MSDFKLEQWEVPTSSLSAAAGKADVLIKLNIWGKKRPLLLRVIRLRDVHGCTFARENDSTTVGSWLLVERRHDALQVWHPHTPPSLEAAAHGLECRDIELARFCVVTDGKQTRRALTLSSGESMWLSVGMGSQEPFDLPLSQTAFFHDGHAHFERMREELARPDSDARFSANWLRWASEKKQRHILGPVRLREIQTVMRSLLQCEQWLWEGNDVWMWSLAAGRDLPSIPFDPLRITDNTDERFSLFLDFARLLMKHFEPPPDHPKLIAHRCVRAFTGSGSFWPTVEVAARPTRHEQLEARLYLREWLQQNSPDRMDLLA